MPQAPSVAIPTRLPLIIEPASRDESGAKDAKLINAYVESNEKTGEHWIYKRPGMASANYPVRSGAGLGVYNWQGSIYSIFGTALYKDTTYIGAVNATGGVYMFASSLGTAPRLQLTNGLVAYNWDNTALTQIAGPNFPGNGYGTPGVKGFAYLDGTTYVLDRTAYIHGSDTIGGMNRPDLWTDTLNILGAQIEPDRGVCIIKQLVYVVVMKEWSTEVFYDALNPIGASPLAPVQGAKINYGCITADSVQEIDGSLFWLATNRSSAVQVVLLENLKPQIISTKAIERLLGEADFTSVASFGIKYEGHRFYGITLKNNNLTLVYDLAEKMWAQWTDPDGNYFKIVSTTFLPEAGRILQHESNGELYLMDAQFFTDAGDPIVVDIFTPNFDGGVRRRKQLTMMEFIGDQVPTSFLALSVNDSDYDSTKWTSSRFVSLDLKKPTLPNCGTFVRRAFHIRHNSPTQFRLQGVELQIDIGTL